MQFIDFTDIKGETWWNATEVCLALGYQPNNSNKVSALDYSGIPNRVVPKQKVNGEVYWNKQSLARFKDALSKAGGKSKKYYTNWDYLEKCMNKSLGETFLPKEKEHKVEKDSSSTITGVDLINTMKRIKQEMERDNGATKRINLVLESGSNDNQKTYMDVYKGLSTVNIRSFCAAAKEAGLPSGFKSWKIFSEHYPEEYEKILELMPNKNKHKRFQKARLDAIERQRNSDPTNTLAEQPQSVHTLAPDEKSTEKSFETESELSWHSNLLPVQCIIHAIKQFKLFIVRITFSYKHVLCNKDNVIKECDELLSEGWLIEGIEYLEQVEDKTLNGSSWNN